MMTDLLNFIQMEIQVPVQQKSCGLMLEMEGSHGC